MNFQTSEEIRRINIALDSLKRRAFSKLLQSRRKQIDPIFQEQILNPKQGSSAEILKEVTTFEESSFMQSGFGKTFIKGWLKKLVKPIWKRLK